MLIAFVGGVAFFVPGAWIPMLVLSVTVIPLSLGTLLHARSRYRAWVDRVVDAYLRDTMERELGIPYITANGKIHPGRIIKPRARP